MRRRALLTLSATGVAGGLAGCTDIIDRREPRERLVQVTVENHDTRARSVVIRLARGDSIFFERSFELDGATGERVDSERIAPPAFESRPEHWWVSATVDSGTPEWQAVDDLTGRAGCYKVLVRVAPRGTLEFEGTTEGEPCEPSHLSTDYPARGRSIPENP